MTFTVIFYFLPILSLLEFLKIYKVPFARNELEALPFSICTGQIKANPSSSLSSVQLL